jgi:hypothetical protein
MEGTLSKSDVNKLKNFVTEKKFTFRRQFSTFFEEHRRCTVLCGTCNSNDFLRDESGDRRYWVLPISGINFQILNDIEFDLLWAEVYFLFEEEESKIPTDRHGLRRNHCHELTKEESNKLISLNKEFTHVTALDDIIDSAFDWNNPDRYYITAQMVATKILKGKNITSSAISKALMKKQVELVRKRLYGNNNAVRLYLLPTPLGIDETEDKDFVKDLKLIKVVEVYRKQ